MTKEEFEKIDVMIENAQWRIVGIVAALLGHIWLGAILFLIPFFGEFVKRLIIRYRIVRLEEELAKAQ